jgi:ATP-dependent RNA helicase DeaD
MSLEKFKELGLSDSILKELAKKGYEEPTEIQKKIIPLLLESDTDIVGQAQTGTGKTGAFGIPLIDRMEREDKKPQVLVLTPTRELAIQIAEELNSYKGKKKIQILPVYGGQSIHDQIKRLGNGIDIIAGTPGRIIDHLERKTINLSELKVLVIDEADEMFHMGFIDELESILKQTNPGKRTLLFSATMPDSILSIAKKYMHDFTLVSTKSLQLTADLTDQIYFEVNDADRFEALCRIIDIETDFYGMVFCRTKISVDELTGRLIDRGYSAEGIHGDFSQAQRERTLEKFKKKRINILVASDVAARGIDVVNLSHVINYSIPQDHEAYVHRVGRTGRAGKKGIAVTFISSAEYRRLMSIQKLAKTKIRKESLPKISDIVDIKTTRIYKDIIRIIEEDAHLPHLKTAKLLLSGNNPEDVLAAIVKYSFDEILDESKYREIRDVSVDKKGTTRLFVSLGKKDGLTPQKLLKMINNATKIPSGRIKDVRILENYSFLTAPFGDAEVILRSFKRSEDGLKPALIKKADDVKNIKGNIKGNQKKSSTKKPRN